MARAGVSSTATGETFTVSREHTPGSFLGYALRLLCARGLDHQ